MKLNIFLKIIVLICIHLTASIPLSAQNNKKAKLNTLPKVSKKEIAKTKAANIKKAAKTQFQYFVIKGTPNGYGYDIYADGNMYIHQPNIPAIVGEQGFADTLSAAKTAKLVIKKIKKGEMPPTINISDLKKINAIN